MTAGTKIALGRARLKLKEQGRKSSKLIPTWSDMASTGIARKEDLRQSKGDVRGDKYTNDKDLRSFRSST